MKKVKDLGHFSNFESHVVHNFLECYNNPSFFIYLLEVIVMSFTIVCHDIFLLQSLIAL